MNVIGNKLPGRGFSYLYLFLLVCPVIFGAALIKIYGVNVFYFDENFIQIFSSTDSSLNFQPLFRQHNEHRIFFPKIVYFLVAKLTNFNSVAVMYASLAVLTAAYLAIARHMKTRLTRNLALISPILIGLFMYSPKQYENMFWGFQIGFYMTYAFSLLAICFCSDDMTRAPRKTNLGWFALAVFCAAIASFSSIQGLVVWCVVAVVWIMAERGAVFKNWKFYVWCLAAFAVMKTYFYGYVKPGFNPELTFIFDDFTGFVHFFFILIGQPVMKIGRNPAALITGIVVCVLSLLVFIDYLRCKRVRDFLSIALIVYGIAVPLSISLGRAGFGLDFASFSRYTTFTFSVYLGLCLYCFFRLKEYSQAAENQPAAERQVGKTAFGLLASAIVLALLISTPDAFKHSQTWKETRLEQRAILCNFENEPFERLYPIVPVENWKEYHFRMQLELLRLHSRNVFAEPGCDGRAGGRPAAEASNP